ncbi:hypothetical protein AAW51_0262 [Caldimonas brevitalea]|uniref:Uncharacterized protein n=1 Tax=Caldimonas brevitalea TaxID=413882 RepID=A0A0G3BG59_9BURK|nr:hypothetical protein AAW51_0262 [Caldimonas brevitalea]
MSMKQTGRSRQAYCQGRQAVGDLESLAAKACRVGLFGRLME